MPSVDFVVSSDVKETVRIKQISAAFDVPIKDKLSHRWKIQLPLEERPWEIGAIIGPSGCGKTQIATQLWSKEMAIAPRWKSKGAVIDEFDSDLSIDVIVDACMSVGFNTIPSWMKPYEVLSNGEKFRVDVARRLTQTKHLCIVDEFTSVVDRQVAKIGCHAVQKYARKQKRQFVAVSCHDDIVDWLQPDWTYNPATNEFRWRLLQQRPRLNITIAPVHYKLWSVFSRFHYLTASLNNSSRCFALWCNGSIASFAAMLFRAGAHKIPIIGCSRLVTLPDYQGLGLAMCLIDHVGGLYAAKGKYVHVYPAHPSLVRSFRHSNNWAQRKAFGVFSSASGATTSVIPRAQGGRHCAVFRFIGAKADATVAGRAFSYWGK
tara:strand:+ start:282 stop:1409 length:1128 start_codon:yes stop_codon:yes gene_type:complete